MRDLCVPSRLGVFQFDFLADADKHPQRLDVFGSLFQQGSQGDGRSIFSRLAQSQDDVGSRHLSVPPALTISHFAETHHA